MKNEGLTLNTCSLFLFGSWCNHNDPHPKPYTYVVTEYDEETWKHTVSLNYWGEARGPEVNVI